MAEDVDFLAALGLTGGVLSCGLALGCGGCCGLGWGFAAGLGAGLGTGLLSVFFTGFFAGSGGVVSKKSDFGCSTLVSLGGGGKSGLAVSSVVHFGADFFFSGTVAFLFSLPNTALGGRLVISASLTSFKSTIIGAWPMVIFGRPKYGKSNTNSRNTAICKPMEL